MNAILNLDARSNQIAEACFDAIAVRPSPPVSTLPEMSDRLPITQDSGVSKQVQTGLGGIQITTLPQPLCH